MGVEDCMVSDFFDGAVYRSLNGKTGGSREQVPSCLIPNLEKKKKQNTQIVRV